ncbi:MAG TPA: ATP-binding protein, partial [Coxiellaceae bacterium]|nr:ATP-binding protein [Coxiellaceae bacterium]
MRRTTSSSQYSAEAIEVLSGLDPVRRRPSMYTNTDRPDHLAREVIDNGVDEVTSGHATSIQVILYKDGSLEVIDDGRGMPIDIHPEEKVSGVELILTRLHAGAKFSNKSYKFSGGLHGVGISVVNALSTKLTVQVRKDGKIYQMDFKDGEPSSKLAIVGDCPKNHRGTSVHFWPDAKYFDNVKFSVPQLKYTLRAKAVLCPGLSISFTEEGGETETWCYQEGLKAYLSDCVRGKTCIPVEPWIGHHVAKTEELDWAISWQTEDKETTTESYVNLIPTIQGGTHVNGFRSGLLEAMRDFCDLHKLTPRGVKLTAEDIWDNCSYILSLKIQEPQFAGQTKERLSSNQCTALVAGIIKDAFSLWLNQHVETATGLAEWVINNAQKRLQLSR